MKATSAPKAGEEPKKETLTQKLKRENEEKKAKEEKARSEASTETGTQCDPEPTSATGPASDEVAEARIEQVSLSIEGKSDEAAKSKSEAPQGTAPKSPSKNTAPEAPSQAKKNDAPAPSKDVKTPAADQTQEVFF